MPWQRMVLDVGLEHVDGVPVYREVVVTVPRQQGKTTFLLSAEIHRAIAWRNGRRQRVYYSAQTGQDGRQKLLDDQVPILMNSPLASVVRQVYRAVGAEGVIFKNGSRIDVMASSEHSGHGKTVDMGIIDEAFSDVDDRREQAVKPAQMTRPEAQLWITSTAGHAGSAYLKRKVDAGRAAVEEGIDRDIAFFEWSAPDGASLDDPEVWRSCMPALGHTVTEDVIRQDLRSMDETPDEFRRAYLNQWTVGEERVIPAGLWNAANSQDVVPLGTLVFGVDVTPDRSSSSIVVADGEKRAEVIETGLHPNLLVARVVELATKYQSMVALDEHGPAMVFRDAIQAEGVKVLALDEKAMSQACARLYDWIADGLVHIRRNDALDLAAAGAKKKVAGDVWRWSRGGVDVSPLIALTMAVDRAARAVSVWVARR